jgi:hypothetical protein
MRRVVAFKERARDSLVPWLSEAYGRRIASAWSRERSVALKKKLLCVDNLLSDYERRTYALRRTISGRAGRKTRLYIIKPRSIKRLVAPAAAHARASCVGKVADCPPLLLPVPHTKPDLPFFVKQARACWRGT